MSSERKKVIEAAKAEERFAARHRDKAQRKIRASMGGKAKKWAADKRGARP